MRAFGLALALLLGPAGCSDANVDRSPRPEARAETRVAARGASFEQWLAGFETRAESTGVGRATLDRARPHLRYLPQSVTLDQRQSEFAARVWEYLDTAVTPARIQQGQRALGQHRATLERITARHGVPPEILVAIWGIETSYGANRGSTPTLATLATLARDGRRGAFFEAQLIDALKIVQDSRIDPAAMVGSWAGAFGHLQFMPSSYRTYAVDFTGNGRSDHWGADPGDALASAARYLSGRGWVAGQPWAIEVAMPAQFDLQLTGQWRNASDWEAAGLRPAAGGRLAQGRARLILPGGARGPAFLAYTNYDVLKEYNISDSYVLAVGHLSDRLSGAGALRGQWPRGDRALTLAERQDLQRRLNALGHDTAGVDGRIGPATVAAVQAWQRGRGLPPDGYVNATLLEALRN